MFWTPQPLAPSEVMCQYADRRVPTSPEWQEVVKRVIGLALSLEVEVGQYVLKGVGRSLPTADEALIPLLKSNAADESRHYRAFQYAEQKFGATMPPSSMVSEWGSLADLKHPIAVAGILEAGVFLISLGILRVFGGAGLTKLSISVAEDEFRHVCSNYAVSKALGTWDLVPYLSRVDELLEWLLEPAPYDRTWNITNVQRWSKELLTNQDSPEFDGLTWFTTHTPPFEVGNDYLYVTREA